MANESLPLAPAHSMHYPWAMASNTSRGDAATIFKPEFKKIDVLNSGTFESALLALMQGKSRIVLDLSNVQFIDSSGLGKIISSLRSFREKGGDMRICSVLPPVQVLFTMVRLDEIVGIDADAEAAELELQKAPLSGDAAAR